MAAAALVKDSSKIGGCIEAGLDVLEGEIVRRSNRNGNGTNLGCEAQLWQAADALRGCMDAAEYKHVFLGLIFLKYISDAFDKHTVRFKSASVLANLAFIVSDWRGELLRDDKRWKYGAGQRIGHSGA